MGWKVRTCPTGTTCSADPKLAAQTSLAAFDAEPLSGSPVIDKVALITGLTTDFVGAKRPAGSANDVGAYEYQAGGGTTTPPPTTTTCARHTPTVSMTGSTTAVKAGTKITYTISVKNNDSSACSNTKFGLARKLPSSSWGGSLSTWSLTLAPGATGTATFAVTSPTSAAAGSYGIGIGTSSQVSRYHTGSDGIAYTVAGATTGLTETVAATQSSYKAGTTVTLRARVLNNGTPVSGAAVKFDALKPNNVNHVILSGTTDSTGYATVSFVSGTGSSSIGLYKLTATATYSGKTTTAATTFSVYL
jgi:hypothetical protein